MSTSPTPVLELQNVAWSKRGHTIVHGTSLALPACGSVAIIGPNGAGKSTLLSLMAGLHKPVAGQVLLGGTTMQSQPIATRAKTIGFMPQRFAPHWDITVEELLAMRLKAACLHTQLAPQAVLELHGMAAFAHARWSSLSGGEQARVLLCTVLATQPPVLLADEPGAALDVRYRLELVQALAQRGRSHLVVVVMHDLDLAFEFFDRIIVMNQGRIVLDGDRSLAMSPLLDQHFGVRFERINVPPQVLLKAHLQQPAMAVPSFESDVPYAD
ncbi:ABC transporter ATP-binding protein [Lampropedia puyangensis]|uniref:ABC transporter ATP-binding protein n=1 Tax=Lampropedia puyangensis TaxID=1330072 RepID=A0A4S8F561_9BURK|nr:ABC transporter ATP-binding protein [Lampropedia puyangensis]THU02568.1 ABC transporter ATP-binding protein [Lampropedia puyangensis]